ncbi:helix-turn-helix domain-containing protein [Paenibacillus sepulcri]|uniref:AraC family transcriptional regulator n=1 Tax=Paenibacillus sepulcri TaxID=359917 RepID=A0ABS7C6B9_9BACL|nr:AraC family transcriptional regulator [Paenibacillus sepulcri]
MFRHPKPRYLELTEVRPNVHWAQIQHVPRSSGQLRTIYDFELMYVFQGELQIHFDDESSRIPAGAGDLLLLPSSIRHRIEILTEMDTRLLGIHFDFFNEHSALAEQDIVVQEDKVVAERFCSLPVNGEDLPAFGLHYEGIPFEMVEWMERIVQDHARGRGNPGYEMACRGLMLLIFTQLLSLPAKSSRPSLQSQYYEAVQNLAADMEHSPGGTWPNGALAERFNVSEDHFIRLFKDIIGMSPHKYLQFVRHREAKRMLRETDMKIELIGRQLGYDDLHNFSKMFKKWQGVSPRAYRKLSIMH